MPWAITGDSPRARIQACVKHVIKFPVFTNDDYLAWRDFLNLLGLSAKSIDENKEHILERQIGILFRDFNIKHVQYVGDSWLKLENIIDNLIREADERGSSEWDVRVNYKVHKHLESMASSLDFVRDKIQTTDDEYLKLLVGLSSLFPLYELLSEIVGNSFVSKGDNRDLNNLMNKEINKFIDLTWHNNIHLGLDRVRNNWGHGLGKFENGCWVTPKNPGSSNPKYLNFISDDLMEYIRVGSSVFIAFNLLSLYKGTQGLLKFD